MWDILRGGGKETRLDWGSNKDQLAGEIVVSPTGDRFASAPWFSTRRCQLWDARTGRMMVELRSEAGSEPESNERLPLKAAFSPDGSKLVVAGERLTLYDGHTGALLKYVDAGPRNRVRCVQVKDDGTVALVLDTEVATVIRRMMPDLEIWDDCPIDHVESRAERSRFTATGGILTGLSTRTLHVLDPPPLSLAHSNLGMGIARVGIVAAGDGSRIATLTRPASTAIARTQAEMRNAASSVLQIWEPGTLRLISRSEQLPGGAVATSLAIGSSADSLALGCIDQDGLPAPVLLATTTPSGAMEFERLGDHSKPVFAMAFSPDGTRLITGSALRR